MSSKRTECVTISFHNISISLLGEFNLRIVGPYFNGNLNEALIALINDALIAEELFQAHLDKRKYRLDVKPKKCSEGEASI